MRNTILSISLLFLALSTLGSALNPWILCTAGSMCTIRGPPAKANQRALVKRGAVGGADMIYRYVATPDFPCTDAFFGSTTGAAEECWYQNFKDHDGSNTQFFPYSSTTEALVPEYNNIYLVRYGSSESQGVWTAGKYVFKWITGNFFCHAPTFSLTTTEANNMFGGNGHGLGCMIFRNPTHELNPADYSGWHTVGNQPHVAHPGAAPIARLAAFQDPNAGMFLRMFSTTHPTGAFTCDTWGWVTNYGGSTGYCRMLGDLVYAVSAPVGSWVMVGSNGGNSTKSLVKSLSRGFSRETGESYSESFGREVTRSISAKATVSGSFFGSGGWSVSIEAGISSTTRSEMSKAMTSSLGQSKDNGCEAQCDVKDGYDSVYMFQWKITGWEKCTDGRSQCSWSLLSCHFRCQTNPEQPPCPLGDKACLLYEEQQANSGSRRRLRA